MGNIKYRVAAIEDLEILYEFEQGIITTERPMDPTLREGHINYYDLKELVESDQAEVMIAEVDGQIVGSGYAQIKNAKSYLKFDRYAHVGFIFVKPEFRRQGISQGVITHLKSWVQSRGIIEMRLNVYSLNPGAIAAYEKLGMVQHMIEMRMEV